MISDISAEVKREKLEEENREMLAMIDRINRDKKGFLEFIEEADGIIDALRNQPREDLRLIKRQVHTLKGNASIFGLDRLAKACHGIEDAIDEAGTIPDGTQWTELFGSWTNVRGNLRRLLSDQDKSAISLSDDDYQTLLRCILDGESRDFLAKYVSTWRLEPTESRMRRIAEQAQSLAERLGKPNLDTRICSGGLLIDPDYWSPFWSAFVHVIRNAIDHGIETAEERKAEGKPETGILQIATFTREDEFVVSVTDDGRGIDWDRVRQKASSLGLPAESNDELMQALFVDGFSTSESVSETSGRGVGMGAVRQECISRGGRIELQSTQTIGTTIRFLFPVATMASNAIDELRSHQIGSPESLVLGGEREDVDPNSSRVGDSTHARLINE